MTSSRASGWLAIAAAGLLLAGCVGVDTRIARNRPAFESWPMAVREKVAAGQVDLGFTREQVAMALGEADRISTRTDLNGTSEIWSYQDRRPRVGFGVGIGFGSWGHRGGSVGGLGIGTGSALRDDEKLGITFGPDGTVAAIEVRGK